MRTPTTGVQKPNLETSRVGGSFAVAKPDADEDRAILHRANKMRKRRVLRKLGFDYLEESLTGKVKQVSKTNML